MRKEMLLLGALSLLVIGCAGTAIVGVPKETDAAVRTSSSAYCLTSPCLYVTNAYGSSVLIYRADQRGVSRPIERIEGPATGLLSPSAIAVDANDNVYVGNARYSSQYTSAITVYPAGHYGNVPPTQTIGGPHTQMGVATGVATDAAGKIYVSNWFGGSPCGGSVTVYAAGANGDASPIAQIKGPKTGLICPESIALDSKTNVYVATSAQYNSSVNVYAAGANGNVPPIAVISGTRTLLYDPTAITLDASNRIYVRTEGGIVKFRAGAHGNVKPMQAIFGFRGLAYTYGIAVDPRDEIYTNSFVHWAILVFASDANGNVRPIRVIRDNRRNRFPTNIAVR